ncbi:MAG TPA: hypothetical protein DDZ41_11500 [Flavobacterium sp.]|nr:hypothetical protein [Flavobacterium sp.]
MKPVLSSGLKFLKKEAVNTGIDLMTGIVQQKPVNQILRDRSLQIVDNLKDKATEKIKNMTGTGCKRKRCMKKRQNIKRNGVNRRQKAIKRKASAKIPHSKNYRVLDIFS